MSTPAPVPASPIDRLRARFARLASDPRIRLLPEAPAILAELVGLVDHVDELERRVGAIERGLAALWTRPDEFE